MTTFRDMVVQVQGYLNQFLTNRPAAGTFTSWKLDAGSNKVAVNLADFATNISSSLVELETGELVYVKHHDSSAGTTTCPAWFRAQNGTPSNDTVTANTKVVVNPPWPTWHVLQTLLQSTHSLYPDLFGVAATTLTSVSNTPNYVLPATCEGILRVDLESTSPELRQHPISRWRMDPLHPDGKKYLRLLGGFPPGRPIYVTYRTKPVVPLASSAAALGTAWSTTGLPDSAADLPVLRTVSQMVATVDAAKLRMATMEQSDQNRLVQGGSAGSNSRLWQQMFTARLAEEKRKLSDLHPPRPHQET